jgi:hypothetical protein
VLARVPAIALPDIAGYWPQTTRPVRGPQEYAKRIIDLLDFIPDFRAEPIEHATNGDVMFVRWIAYYALTASHASPHRPRAAAPA